VFRRNERHQQGNLFSEINNLTAKARADLEQSWAGVYYRECFCRLDETVFAVLYSDEASRPNIPVNILVGLETLKAGFGWSDAEMYDHFRYDIQVRYALGLWVLGEGEFQLRTVYNFRRRLVQHYESTGENLLDQAFAQVTDAQIRALQLKTRCLRMDSTQVASNIRRMTRLEFAVEILQRVYRMLSADDQAHYAEAFAPYLQGSSEQYVYHLRGEETAPHLQRVGELMHRLLAELKATYEVNAIYTMLQRVFGEQFDLVDGAVQVKPGKQISPRRLRSPDDTDATFRRKGEKEYEGFVANVTETCEPDNPIQLITKVQTAPNVVEDTQLLAEALPELKKRTGVEVLYNDAGFCGADADKALRKEQVLQVPTDLRGRAPNPVRLNLADFETHTDGQGQPVAVTCPHGETVTVRSGRTPKHCLAYFPASACSACPLQDRCPTRLRQRDGRRTLRFDRQQLDTAQRRRRCAAYRREGKNPRAAIEATVGAVKRPFNDDQLPVRGLFRVGAMLLGSAMMVNVRRMQRYFAAKAAPKRPAEGSPTGREAVDDSQSSFSSLLQRGLARLFGPAASSRPKFALGC